MKKVRKKKEIGKVHKWKKKEKENNRKSEKYFLNKNLKKEN